jgi:hypothetical protein
MRPGFYTLKATVGIQNIRNLPTWRAWTSKSANPSWKSPPSGSLCSKRKSLPYRKRDTSSLFSPFNFHISLPLHTCLLFCLFFLATKSGFSLFLFLPCFWFRFSDSIWYWIISSYPCFWAMNFFGFLSFVIADFSNICRCPNPNLDTYN